MFSSFVLWPLASFSSFTVLVGMTVNLKMFHQCFQLVITLAKSPIKNWASFMWSSCYYLKRWSEICKTMMIPHFCFTPIVEAVRRYGIYWQEREETKCCGGSKHEQLATVSGRALELADSSGNSSCLLLYTVGFHLLFDRVFQLHNQMLDLYYHCVGSSNTILRLKRMYYSTCRWRYTLPNTHELNI